MIGSRLLGVQPAYHGADFDIPEIRMLGYHHFREAIATSDSWDQHEGIELVLMRSGEAAWEVAGNSFRFARGGEALVFPPNSGHRVAHGIYTPCRLCWIVFHPFDDKDRPARLFSPGDLELLRAAAERTTTVRLSENAAGAVAMLCSRLLDERLLIGSAQLLSEVRARLYSCVVEVLHSIVEGDAPTRSPLVTRALGLLAESLDRPTDSDGDTIEQVARRLGYGTSRLYSLFASQVGMTPNDYRQRLRIRRSCTQLRTSERSVTDVAFANGFNSSQYFARVFRKYVGVSPTEYRVLFAGTA